MMTQRLAAVNQTKVGAGMVGAFGMRRTRAQARGTEDAVKPRVYRSDPNVWCVDLVGYPKAGVYGAWCEAMLALCAWLMSQVQRAKAESAAMFPGLAKLQRQGAARLRNDIRDRERRRFRK